MIFTLRISCFCFSGFVEQINMKDYSQNRDVYVNRGKGADFRKAVSDIDGHLNGIKVK